MAKIIGEDYLYYDMEENLKKRKPHEFYPTPEFAVKKLLNHRKLYGNILEPTAGDGAILRAIRDFGYDNKITSVEIRKEEEEKLREFGDVYITDFFDWVPDKKYDTIITNPPYSIAKEIIIRCFDILAENGQIIILMKTEYLECAEDKYDFWHKYPVSHLYALSQKPVFEDESSNSAYAWYVWDRTKGTIDVI